jgi:hypothetical protein
VSFDRGKQQNASELHLDFGHAFEKGHSK